MNRIDLAGRAAVVTGGARGIGYACAERLLASGATVALWDKDESRSRRRRAASPAPARCTRASPT